MLKWLLLLVVVLAVWLVYWVAQPGARGRCTHGLSSVGPVSVAGGRVTGDTVPHTEACLP